MRVARRQRGTTQGGSSFALGDFLRNDAAAYQISPPRIVDINPRFGPYFASQTIWLKVQNLHRGNGLRYSVRFGETGVVSTSFLSSKEDEVQMLECITPTTSAPCVTFLSLMYHDDPQTPIGSSDIYYEFAASKVTPFAAQVC